MTMRSRPISLTSPSCGSIDDMNKNLIRKFATATLAAATLVGPVVGLAPAAFADTEPTPAGDQLGVIHTDGEQDVVAIIGQLPGDFELAGDTAFPCDELDESVRGPKVEGQENYCYLDRSSLARDLPVPTPATVPDLDPNLGIMPIMAGVDHASPATDAGNAGTWLSIGLSALAVGGTAVSLARRNRRVEA